MDRDMLLNMDSYMTLSIVNMKLRDEFSSLEDFSAYYNITRKEIEDKLKVIGYYYENTSNSFIALP
jgi:Domain of unknown function (DUF4250)